MTIPIRLLAGSASEVPIDLIAQSIDISVDRNVSAFPTPNNYLKRFAVDTNIPAIKIDINGIFVDDEIISVTGDANIKNNSPSQIMINCASILPTVAKTEFIPVGKVTPVNFSPHAVKVEVTAPAPFLPTQAYSKGSTTVIECNGTYDLHKKTWANSYSTHDFGLVDTGLKWDVSKSAGTAPALFAVEIKYTGYDIADYPDTGSPNAIFNIGERVVDADNNFIGIIAETSATGIKFEANTAHAFSSGEKIFVNPMVFNELSELVGYAVDVSDDGTIEPTGNEAEPLESETLAKNAVWSITLAAANLAAIRDGKRLYVNATGSQWNAELRDVQLKLVPSYLQEDFTRSPSGMMHSGDYLKYDKSGKNHTQEYTGVSYLLVTNAGVTTSPSVRHTFEPNGTPVIPRTQEQYVINASNAYRYQGLIEVPVKDIIEATNPAVTLATQIEDAINRTGHLLGDHTSISFTDEARVSITGASYTNSTEINHSANPNVKVGMAVRGGSGMPTGAYVTSVNSNTQFVINEVTTGGAKSSQTLSLVPNTFSVERKGPLLIITQNYIPDETSPHPEQVFSLRLNAEVYHKSPTAAITTSKSAGDKVQDLIGIVSNASKMNDLLRGIQIPYNSLITSSGVTAVARNFFLTFGEIPVSEKGSVANTRPATEVMSDLILAGNTGTNKPDKSERNIFDKFVDAVVPDDIQSLAGWLVNAVQDLWVTLDTPPHGNDGGIRIIPEKLHVRYDAGNNYYAFNLELMASDFVIGV